MPTLAKILLVLIVALLIGLILAAILLTLLGSDPGSHSPGDPTPPPPPPTMPAPGSPPPADTAPPPAPNPRATSIDHDCWHTQPVDIRHEFQAFVTSFDGADDNDGDGASDHWAIPEWVAYQIDAHPTPLGKAPDRPTWTTDSALFKQKIAPADGSYAFSKAFRADHPDSPLLGYDRGHMCMKYLAFRRGAEADAETHTMLNACPQKHDLNAGIWEDLEEKTGRWADEFGTVWVVCGPILNSRKVTRWLGEPDEVPVAIPDAFYKIVIRATSDPRRPAVLAFVFPHEDPRYAKPYAGANGAYDERPYLTAVDEVEKQTGLDFLTVLAPEDQSAVESAAATAIWP